MHAALRKLVERGSRWRLPRPALSGVCEYTTDICSRTREVAATLDLWPAFHAATTADDIIISIMEEEPTTAASAATTDDAIISIAEEVSTTIAVVTADMTIPNTVDMATLPDFADLIGNAADDTNSIASTSTTAVVTTDVTISNTVDMATLSVADLTDKIADGTIDTTASDTINPTGMQPFSVRGSTAHGGPSQKTNGPAQPLGLKWAQLVW